MNGVVRYAAANYLFAAKYFVIFDTTRYGNIVSELLVQNKQRNAK